MAPPDGIVVRHATREDVPTILQLIHGLAAYAGASSDVKATPDLLLNSIAFAPSPFSSASSPSSSTSSVPHEPTMPITPTRPARCLLVQTPAGTVAGMAIYFYNYSTWHASAGIYLEDLFIRESERRKGYAQVLLVELAREVVGMKGGRLEWNVLRWNEPSIRFYETLGARMMSEWVGMRVDGEALVNLAKRGLES